MIWTIRRRQLELTSRPLVMGIVNVTPDSFSDGGQFFNSEQAIAHAMKLIGDGADIVDVGGESSRPGSKPVATDEELRRVVDVVRGIARQSDVPISVDTTKAAVARAAIDAGASIVNDIKAGLGDAEMANVVRETGAGVVLMHMQGTPETMQQSPAYADVVGEVRSFLANRIRVFCEAGVHIGQISVDPGIGFGKTYEHNLALLRRLDAIADLHRPVVLGVSRKGFLQHLTRRPVHQRVAGSLATAVYCATRGTAHVIRVHDVAESVDAAKVVGALRG